MGDSRVSNRLQIRLSAIIGVSMASYCGTAQAVLLWYDGFATGPGGYVAGQQLGGQSGGAGSFFAGPWMQDGGNDSFVQAAGLSYPGLTTSGGSTADTDPATCCITARNQRQMAAPFNNFTSGTFYQSFLVNFGTDGDPANFGDRVFEMWNGGFDDVHRTLALGYSQFGAVGSAGSSIGVNVQGISTTLAGSPMFATDGDTHLVVLKFQLSDVPLSDSVSVFLDPSDSFEPPVASASISGIDFGATSQGAMSQFSFSSNPNPASFDEVRVGTSFGDVAPLNHIIVSLAATGNWTNASIWNPPSVPNNGNGGASYDVVVGNGSTATIIAGSNIQIQGLALSNGTISVSSNGSLLVRTGANWSGGTLSGAGSIQIKGTSTISGAGTKTLSTNLTNSGAMTVQSGTVTFSQSGATQAQLHNTGSIDLVGGGTSFAFGSGSPSFVNESTGTVRRLGVPGSVTIDVATTNQGLMQVASSSISFTRGLTINNGGNVQLISGTITSSQTVAIANGGQLTGHGTVEGNVALGTDAGPLQSTFSPGLSASGAFAINGNYQQGSKGVFLEKIDGRSEGQFAVTNVSGTAQLGGTLRVDVTNLNTMGLYPYTPVTIISSSSLIGPGFSTVETVGNHFVKFVPSYQNFPGAGAGEHSGGASSIGLVSGYLGYAGDVSGDGLVTPLDVTAFAEYLVNPISFLQPGHFPFGIPSLADVDGWDVGNPTAPCGNGKLDFDDIPYFVKLLTAEGVLGSAASVYAAIDAARNVPEPPSIVLMICAGGLLLVYYASLRIRENNPVVAFRQVDEAA